MNRKTFSKMALIERISLKVKIQAIQSESKNKKSRQQSWYFLIETKFLNNFIIS
jgi:hypothetical protein